MGYYSEVKVEICIDGMTPQELLEMIKNDLKERSVELSSLFNKALYVHDAIILKADGIKWYITYTEVEAFETYLRELGNSLEEDEDISGYIRFMRLGEDCDDTEDWGYGDYWDSNIEIVRYIDYGPVAEEIELDEEGDD